MRNSLQKLNKQQALATTDFVQYAQDYIYSKIMTEAIEGNYSVNVALVLSATKYDAIPTGIILERLSKELEDNGYVVEYNIKDKIVNFNINWLPEVAKAVTDEILRAH